MKLNDFAVKRYVDHEIFHLTRSYCCPSRNKQFLSLKFKMHTVGVPHLHMFPVREFFMY